MSRERKEMGNQQSRNLGSSVEISPKVGVVVHTSNQELERVAISSRPTRLPNLRTQTSAAD